MINSCKVTDGGRKTLYLDCDCGCTASAGGENGRMYGNAGEETGSNVEASDEMNDIPEESAAVELILGLVIIVLVFIGVLGLKMVFG